MEKLNFRMLALAREARGLTQMELAKKMNMTQSNYSKLEKGLVPFVHDDLDYLEAALGFPRQFYYKGYQLNNLSQFYYRKRLTMKSGELSLLESRFKLFAMALDDMLSSVAVPEFQLPAIEVTKLNTPEVIATKIRAFLRVPPGPINSLVNLIESAGVIVHFMRDVPEKFDGMTMITNSGQPVVFINEMIPNDRKRFTLAHELAHIIMHLRVDASVENDDMDKEADRFASEFLMPLPECRREIEQLKFRELGTLKAYWKVSKAAIISKAYRQGYLDPSRYKTFLIEMSRAGETKNENGFVEIDQPVLIDKIVHAHLNKLQYTKEQLLELLAISEGDFQNLFTKTRDLVRQPILKVLV